MTGAMLGDDCPAVRAGHAVGDYLVGNLAGQGVVADLQRGMCDQDLLFKLTRTAAPELASEYVRGLLRALQKELEQLPRLVGGQGTC